MASGSCQDAFVALMDCVAAAVMDDDGTGTARTTQPLPCLDAADSVRKCMEENAGKYAYTLDRISAGAGEGSEADASNNANRSLVLDVKNMQEEYAEVQEVVDVQKEMAAMEPRIKECKHAFEALEECVAGLAAGGPTTTTLSLACMEGAVSFNKCMETHSVVEGRSRC